MPPIASPPEEIWSRCRLEDKQRRGGFLVMYENGAGNAGANGAQQ